MKHKVLFLSHAPHEVHRNFADTIDARVLVLPFKKFVDLTKKFPFLKPLYPLLTWLYGLTVRSDENVLIVSGGSSFFTALALKLKNRDRIIIFHDLDLLFYNLQSASSLKKKVGMSLLKNIDGIITVSEENKKCIPLRVPIRICPPYVDEVVRLEFQKRSGYGLYVGRLDPDKKIERLIAFVLQCTHIEKFTVVGDGVLSSYVRKISNANKKIEFVGYQEDVAQYYSLCSFFIHLPDHDPHPKTILEAAQYGCFPIISTGVGTAYLFDDQFIVSNPDDFSEINEKIQYMRDHSDKMKTNLQNSVKKLPTKDDTLRRFKAGYDELINICTEK